MIVKDFIDNMNKIVEKNPDILNKEVCVDYLPGCTLFEVKYVEIVNGIADDYLSLGAK